LEAFRLINDPFDIEIQGKTGGMSQKDNQGNAILSFDYE